MSKIKKLLILFLDYFKIGLFTFGGGYAMISLIEKTFVDKRKQITSDELLDIVAIAEATPGVIAINSATYIGYKILGVLGSIFATIAVSLPSFIIILFVSIFYEQILGITWLKNIISGLMIGVIFLIFKAGIKLFKSAKKDALVYFLISFSFLSLLIIKYFKLNISTIYLIIFGAILSLIIYTITLIIRKKKEKIIEKEMEEK